MKYIREVAAATALIMAGTGCGAAESLLSKESANEAQIDAQLDEQSLQQISEVVLREWEEDGVKKTASYKIQEAGKFILTLDEAQQSAGQAARSLRLEIGCNGTAPTVNTVGNWPESQSSPADYEQGLKEEGYCDDKNFSLNDAKELTRLLSSDEIIKVEESREKTLLTENKDGFTFKVEYSSAGKGVVRHTAKNNKTGEEVLALTQKCATDGSGVLESTLGPDLNRIYVDNGADFGGKAADLFAGCDDGKLTESEARVAMSLALSKE